MNLLRSVACYSILFVLNGCGASTPAAATRVVAADATGLSTTPICFTPPDPALSLTDRAQQLNIQGICEDVARKQSVSVVTSGSQPCLAVSMIWAVRDTGDRDGDCTRTWAGAECESTAIHAKSLKLVLTEPVGGRVLAETTAAIRSSREYYSNESFHALCSAAFRDFPRPLSNAQFDVPVD